MLVREVLATFWLRSRRLGGAQLTLFDALEVLSIPILVPSNTKSHVSEYSPEQRGAATNVVKTDGEDPKPRARRRRLPEAEQLSRTRRDIDRGEAYARGDSAGEKVTARY